MPFDLGDSSSIDAAFAEVASKVTRIHVQVNNAGITHRGMILDTAMSVHRRVMEVNYFGTIDLTQHVLRHMVQSGGGKVVMLSSILGLMATPQRSAYVAAKHALTALHRSALRRNHGPGHPDPGRILVSLAANESRLMAGGKELLLPLAYRLSPDAPCMERQARESDLS